MSKPCGLILSAGAVSGAHVRAGLDDQGGPAWDETVFRMLSGLDVASLVEGRPAPGHGMALTLASSGWWLRHLDDLAERLARLSGADVVALTACDVPAVSGWHLARADGQVQRRVVGGSSLAWVDGVAELVARPVDSRGAPPLEQIAWMVHGQDSRGAHLPGMVALRLDPSDPRQWETLVQVLGAALVHGWQWRPGPARDPGEQPPTEMRALILQGAVRLPGPPRWARATRAIAIRTAEDAIRGDGWVCLVPEQSPGQPAVYGSAVRMLQLAPLGDGSALGVLHPRAAVKVGEIRGGLATVEPQADDEADDPDGLARAVGLLTSRLHAAQPPVHIDHALLRASPDPASLIAWQIRISPEACQGYLAARGPVGRVRVLSDFLASG